MYESDSESSAPALINTLSHMANNLSWVERLDVFTKPAPASKGLEVQDDPSSIDADDDFKRENYFYRVAQAAVLKAIPRLHELGVPTKRPDDYFAEMVKTDEHMDKVKHHLVENQQRLTLRERAREIREKRKFAKQTQLAVLQARKAEKRKLTEAIKTSRKKSGKERENVLDGILKEFQTEHDRKEANRPKPGFHRAKDVANRRKVNYKRDYRNKLYGHGGQKKRSKRNSSESFKAAFRQDFNPDTHQGKVGGPPRLKAKPSVKSKFAKGKAYGKMKQKRR